MVDTKISVEAAKDAVVRLLRSYGQHVSADSVEALTKEEIQRTSDQRTAEQQEIGKLRELLQDIVGDYKLYEACPYCKTPGGNERRCPLKKGWEYLHD